MFIPFLSSFSVSNRRDTLEKRRGGGGAGRGSVSSSSRGSSSSSSGSRSSGSSSSSSGGRTTSSSSTSRGSRSSGFGSTSSSTSSTRKSSSISYSGSSRSSTSYGGGGGRSNTVPAGQPFAGRILGGGTRSQVFGTRAYGSGYPGLSGRGTAGRSFPFYFWPVVWGGTTGAGAGAYLHASEYGNTDNTTRPGGPLYTASFQANSADASVFRIMGDNSSVTSLVTDLATNCSSYLSSSTPPTPSPFNASDVPKPEQAIQYYRASTMALTLDGYNNTAVYQDEGATDVALPSVVINTSAVDGMLLVCLNETIGLAVPLVDGSSALPHTHSGVLFALGVLWAFRIAFGWV